MCGVGLRDGWNRKSAEDGVVRTAAIHLMDGGANCKGSERSKLEREPLLLKMFRIHSR